MRRIETAEQRRRAPVNDSEMVDEMFGFIDSQADTAAEAGAPLAFKVQMSCFTQSYCCHLWFSSVSVVSSVIYSFFPKYLCILQ